MNMKVEKELPLFFNPKPSKEWDSAREREAKKKNKHGILGEKKQELNQYIFEVINPKKLWKEEKPIYIAQSEQFERA